MAGGQVRTIDAHSEKLRWSRTPPSSRLTRTILPCVRAALHALIFLVCIALHGLFWSLITICSEAPICVVLNRIHSYVARSFMVSELRG